MLEPTTRFRPGWAIKVICDHLQAVTEGRIDRLLINIPPAMAKSLIVGVFWPAWEWGPAGLPSLRYLTASYEQDLAVRDNLRMRRLITSDWYQRYWGDLVTMTGDQNAKMKFENTATGWRECRAFTSLTGGRGDRVIIDDPHSVKTAESDVERAEVVRLFLEGVPHRINDFEGDLEEGETPPENDRPPSAIVVVMQRLHEQDVSGAILARDLGYVHLCLPMEFEPGRRCETSIGFVDPRTYEGELLHPARFGRAAVEKLKASLGPVATAGQLQQRPSPREGSLFKVDLIEIVDALPVDIIKRVRSWDFAATKPLPGKDPDWTAGVRMERGGDGVIYVVDSKRTRDNPERIERFVKATATVDTTAVSITIPEDPGQAGKAQSRAYVRNLAGYVVTPVKPTGDKVRRATPFSSQVDAGNVKLLRGAWNDAYKEELRTFPAGAHDDQVDASSDAFNEIADIKAWEGLAEFYRQEAAKVQAEIEGVTAEVPDEEMVLVRPPEGLSIAYGRDGTRYDRSADGTMLVRPEDAGPLLSQMGWRRVDRRAA